MGDDKTGRPSSRISFAFQFNEIGKAGVRYP